MSGAESNKTKFLSDRLEFFIWVFRNKLSIHRVQKKLYQKIYKIFGLTNFRAWSFLVQKNLVGKILFQKFFLSNIYLVKKFVSENFWSEKFCPKNLWVQKSFRFQKFRGQKIFGFKTFVGSKTVTAEIFLLTYVARTDVAWTNVTVTVGIC